MVADSGRAIRPPHKNIYCCGTDFDAVADSGQAIRPPHKNIYCCGTGFDAVADSFILG